MDVGIREFKAHLSELVDRASRGDRIRITHRGKPKAVIGPISVEDRIGQGIREGWIRPGNGEPPRPVERRFKATMTVQEMMDEDRGD